MTLTTIKNSFVGFCAVVTLVLVGFYVSRQTHLKETALLFEAKNNQKIALEKEIEQVKVLLNKFETEKQEFAKLLFDERDVPAFLDQISKFASDTEVNLIDMRTQSFRTVEVPKDFRESSGITRMRDNRTEAQMKEERKKQVVTLAAMPINIKVQGNFSSLVKFLYSLQYYEQLISINRVEILATQNYPILECNFMLNIYSLKTLEQMRKL